MIPFYVKLLARLHRGFLLVASRVLRLKRSFRTWFPPGLYDEHRRTWQSVDIPAGAHPQNNRQLIYPDTLVHAQGLYLASVVPLPIKIEAAQRMLPRALEVAPQTITPEGEHPVLLLFGHQRAVRPNFLEIQGLQGMEYLEFILAIPYVQWRKAKYPYRGPLVFMPRLFLDEVLPVLLGWLCGYAKRRARVNAGFASYHVGSLARDAAFVEGQFVPRGAPHHPADFPLFQPLWSIFEQPIVGKTLLGPFVCTYFNFHLERARMQAIEARVRIDYAFVPGLPLLDYQVPGIDRAPLGAFRFIVPWTLTAPFEPDRLRTGAVTT